MSIPTDGGKRVNLRNTGPSHGGAQRLFDSYTFNPDGALKQSIYGASEKETHYPGSPLSTDGGARRVSATVKARPPIMSMRPLTDAIAAFLRHRGMRAFGGQSTPAFKQIPAAVTVKTLEAFYDIGTGSGPVFKQLDGENAVS